MEHTQLHWGTIGAQWCEHLHLPRKVRKVQLCALGPAVSTLAASHNRLDNLPRFKPITGDVYQRHLRISMHFSEITPIILAS